MSLDSGISGQGGAGATVMSSHKTPQIFSRRSEERPVGTFAQHRKQGPQGVLHIPGKPRSAPGRGPGLAGDVEDALRALLPMLRERSDRTFLRPPAENLRRLVRRHYRCARTTLPANPGIERHPSRPGAVSADDSTISGFR